MILISPPNDHAAACGTYWKYPLNIANFDYSPWFHAESFVFDFEWRGNINLEPPDQCR